LEPDFDVGYPYEFLVELSNISTLFL